MHLALSSWILFAKIAGLLCLQQDCAYHCFAQSKLDECENLSQLLSMLGCVNAASKSYQTYDSSHLRAAGIGGGQGHGRAPSKDSAAQSAASTLRWECQRPETPTEIKKYRQSTLHTPGVTYKHFGAADDPADKERVYGRVRHGLQGYCDVLSEPTKAPKAANVTEKVNTHEWYFEKFMPSVKQ